MADCNSPELKAHYQERRATAPVSFEERARSWFIYQQVVLMLGSAHRDEACFADPDRFDMTRSPNHHLALGTGIHFCLGAPLARLQAKIALTALLEELEDIEIASEGPIVHLPGIQVNGLVSLPLRFRAEGV